MISWSSRRKFVYVGGGLIVIIFALALPTFFVVYKAPSCGDGILNQGETGIDCGGPCVILCQAEALDPTIHWQRSFKVKDGVYNAVAYIENPNLNSGAFNASYLFKLYDKDNLLIYERRGQTFMPPGKFFAIFESNILTGDRKPARTFFEFLSPLVWRRGIFPEAPIIFSEKNISVSGAPSRVTATLENRNLYPIYNIEVVVVVYDLMNNAIASSRTVVDSVDKTSSEKLVFTWPESFAADGSRVDLLYRILGQ